MDNVTLVKQKVRMEEWAQQIRTCRESGSSVAGWCRENGINPKTYYYRLRKLREKACEQIPVPVSSFPERPGCNIIIRHEDGLTVEISDGISAETIGALIRAMRCCRN
jgi:hypothetical protein